MRVVDGEQHPGAGLQWRTTGRRSRFRSVRGSWPQAVDLEEASRQLELAAHDIAVAATCLGLGDLDEAHINVITARAAADAAEEIIRIAVGGSGPTGPAGPFS